MKCILSLVLGLLLRGRNYNIWTECHEDYQCVFGEQASLHTIMKHRISHMNPPIPKSVCEEEMQNANLGY